MRFNELLRRHRPSSKGVDHVAALEHLSHQIIDADDRLLFQEAIGSARSGALRAAYIMTWLTAAESLKRKFREIAPRDAGAQLVVSEIARRETAHQSIDMYVLGQAKGYGLITDADYQKLENIYAGRCLYGHPYEQQPSPAALVAAGTDVVGFVLSKPTRLRHGYLSQQISYLVTQRTFLDDLQQSVQRFAEEIIAKCDESLYLWFLQTYWKQVAPLFSNPSNQVEQRRAVWLSAVMIERLYNQIEKHWNIIADLTAYSELLSQIFAMPTVFGKISTHAKEIVVSNLLASAHTSPKSLLALEQLDEGRLLDAQQNGKFLLGLSQLHLLIVAQSGIKASYFVERIIAELKSHTWPRQNPAILMIKNIGAQQVRSLDPAIQKNLGANVLQAAEGSSMEAGKFIDEVCRATPAWPVDFIEGMVSECFINDSQEIRFKNEHVSSAVGAISTLPENLQNEIVERLSARIRNGSLKHYISPTDRDTAVNAIQSKLGAMSPFCLRLIEGINSHEFLTPRQIADRQ